MSRPPSPNPCCRSPPNPWVPDSSGNYPTGGCECDCTCVKYNSILLRKQSDSPTHNINISENIAKLDNIAIAFSSSAGSVQRALDAAIVSPTSYAGSVAAIFSQDAAAAANANNLQNTLTPQAASVAAVSTSIAASKASRLAYRSLTESTYALNNVNNLNLNDLAILVANAKLATDALISVSNDANVAAQAVYTTASSISTAANNRLISATAELAEKECNAAKTVCNAVPGSTYQRVTDDHNIVAIRIAKNTLDILTTAATKAVSAENAAHAVAITTTNAYIAALEARDTAIAANTPFVTAASTAAAAAFAFARYQSNPINDNLTASTAANAAAAAAKMTIPPLQKLKDLVVATSAASALANAAAANARTLSASLDIEAKNAAIPLHNPVTSQMIAKQTAAAERFGAAAAAAASRAARQSATPVNLPFIPTPRASVYNVRSPAPFLTERAAVKEARAAVSLRAVTLNPRYYNPF